MASSARRIPNRLDVSDKPDEGGAMAAETLPLLERVLAPPLEGDEQESPLFSITWTLRIAFALCAMSFMAAFLTILIILVDRTSVSYPYGVAACVFSFTAALVIFFLHPHNRRALFPGLHQTNDSLPV